MKKTFSFFLKRNVLCGFLLTGFFILMGISSTNAQSTPGGTDNPQIAIATSFNVTAYTLGTFDRTESIAALQAMILELQGQLNHNPSTLLRMKYKYVNAVLSDVENYYIATEISLLTNLAIVKDAYKLTGQVSATPNQSAPSSQYASVYNEVVSQLQ